jgi:hypothetical protein
MRFWTVSCFASACAALVALACSSSTNTLGNNGGSAAPSQNGTCPSGTGVSDGQTYVQEEGCQQCHGPDMSGSTTPLANGTDGIKLGNYQGVLDTLYPPNLTPDAQTGIGNWTNEQIGQAITQGIDNNSLRLCPEMGSHYPTMCQNEVTGIIAYLRSIPAVVKQVPTSICPPLKQNPDGGL